MKYLTTSELIALNTAVLLNTSEKSTVRNAKGLESIEALPQQAFFGIEAYSEFYKKIGIVFIKIINLHPFEDGNKRTAVMAASVIAKMNGFQLNLSNQGIADLALKVASVDENKLKYEDVYRIFQKHLHKLK
ncbi:type II toxin-antitoxin system death-on-curing family toxin [Levilactobacillus parabrevis]|uniref:type II toxin-antitoxin system death-on-curing family toxin n=1 Tax=Levilactobacillus parabrevis TaxID=357278 RepID=UPI0037570BD4